MDYKKTNWVDHKTPVDAKRLNNIENAIDKLSKMSVTPGKLKTINGNSIVGQGDLSLADLGGVDEEDIKEGLGYTPADIEDIPIWDLVEEDGSITKNFPDIRLGQGLICAHGETAVGRFNLTVPGNVFEIGSGTSHEDRRNSLEVRETGEVYIFGIGGYDGTNSLEPSVFPLAKIDEGGRPESEIDPRVWIGTMTEYEALGDYDPKCLYFIKKS